MLDSGMQVHKSTAVPVQSGRKAGVGLWTVGIATDTRLLFPILKCNGLIKVKTTVKVD